MKSFRLFALPFILLLAPTAQAEKPLMTESAWLVSNHDYLIDIASNIYGLDRRSLEFPDEIKSDAAWLGGTITDGNEIWTWMILQLKDDAPALTPPSKGFGEAFKGWGTNVLLKLKLRTNVFIDVAYPDGNFQMHKNDDGILLISPGFDKERGAVLLKNHFDNLDNWRDWYFVFMQHYPERTLLPTLPPEQEDEGSFIKKVRRRSAEDYKEGQDTGTVASNFLGLRFEDHGCQIVWEVINIDESSSLSDTEPLPFQFGGFINPAAPAGAAFRLLEKKENIDKAFVNIKCGTRVKLPEEREDGKTYETLVGISVSSRLQEEEGFHLIREGNLGVFYPKRHENRPAEEGVLSNEELDEINEESARSILALLSDVRESVLSLDWEQPMDVALSLENEVMYLAISFPPGIVENDWHLFEEQFKKNWYDHFQAVRPTEWDTAGDIFDGFFPIIQEQGEQATVSNLPYHWIKFSLLGNDLVAVYGHESEKIYVAVPWGNSDEISEGQIEAMWQHLVQKVDDSKQAVAEKIEPPKTVFRSEMEGYTFRLDYDPSDNGFRCTAYIEQNSLGTALALIANYGGDYLKQALPFLKD